MHKIKIFCYAFIVLVLVSFLISCSSQSKGIVGTWEFSGNSPDYSNIKLSILDLGEGDYCGIVTHVNNSFIKNSVNIGEVLIYDFDYDNEKEAYSVTYVNNNQATDSFSPEPCLLYYYEDEDKISIYGLYIQQHLQRIN